VEAIILAGGLGTRLQPIVPNLPKPMAPISGRPFLEILLTMLSAKGFQRIVLSLGHMSGKFVEYFGNKYAGMELVYEVESLPLGTGGATRRAMDRCDSDHAFVINGDTYLDLEADEIEAQWRREGKLIVVAREMPDTSRYGRLTVENGCVTGFTEKGVVGPGLINAGCYVFPRTIRNRLPKEATFSLERDFLVTIAGVLPLQIFVSRGRFIDIGVPEDYVRAQHDLAGVWT
jgi:D-glycero-alpha-D-manno-heptose 1-phosphate guanylyltransferase